jgi:hypothetical protein
MSGWLDLGAAVFAFVAAVFWFLSAARPVPPMVKNWDSTPESDPLYLAVKFSARMNAIAATFAGLSAILLAVKSAESWAFPREDARPASGVRGPEERPAP